jgi:hypothetical protein
MRFRWACITLCAAQFWGCGNPQPVLTGVDPSQAYSDADVQITLTGDNFLPATTLDPASGSRVDVIDGFHVLLGKANAWAELTNLAWQSTNQMTAVLPGELADALPDENLDVELWDPRGQRAVAKNAFVEFGRDLTPPSVLFTSPPIDTPVGPGTSLRGNIHASDAPPGGLASIAWTYSENDAELYHGECDFDEYPVEGDCPFKVGVSRSLNGGEQVRIKAIATDNSQNHNSSPATLSFTVQALPTVSSVYPTSGGTAGGTDVVITGTGFLAGSQATVDGVKLFPEGGIVVNETTLSGHVPAHAAGSASIIVSTPLSDDASGDLTFTYLPPPLVETITPSTGAATGGTAVVLTGKGFSKDTRIYFGSTLDSAVPLVDLYLQSDSTIIGLTPAGSGQTWVWAFDEALGFTRLPTPFTWRTP